MLYCICIHTESVALFLAGRNTLGYYPREITAQANHFVKAFMPKNMRALHRKQYSFVKGFETRQRGKMHFPSICANGYFLKRRSHRDKLLEQYSLQIDDPWDQRNSSKAAMSNARGALNSLTETGYAY